MSLFLDQKYLMLISNRLPLFKKKKDAVYNCRCILCGDSTKNKHKARGYFFQYKTDLRYKCYNCDVSISFGNFLRDLDAMTYSQYSLERYSEGHSKAANAVPEFKFEEPVFKSSEDRLLDKLLDRLDTQGTDNEAVVFCEQRKIPKEKFKQLYYISNIKDIVQLNEEYKESIKGEEPRLVLPFYDEVGQLSGVTCRALRGEALRYITVKIKDNTPLIFGINDIDKKKAIHVVEGPIDSLFVDNCIAVGGSSFSKLAQLDLPKDNLVIIFDNQPRNKEVCTIIEKNIDQGYKIVIWPQTLQEKDINDMVLAGKNVSRIIKENTFSGLTAKAKFYSWKRV
jgi:hypothetical protein